MKLFFWRKEQKDTRHLAVSAEYVFPPNFLIQKPAPRPHWCLTYPDGSTTEQIGDPLPGQLAPDAVLIVQSLAF